MSGGFAIGNALANPKSYGVSLASFAFGTTKPTPGATAHTKGAWTQLTASTDCDCEALHLKLTGRSEGTSINNCLMDIGVGAAGSEVVLLPNLNLLLGGGFVNTKLDWLVPVHIPAGTRIACRDQTNQGSAATCNVGAAVAVYDGGFETQSFAGADDIGTNLASSCGTSLTTGASSAKGSYAQLIASTTRDYEGLAVMVDRAGTAAASDYFVIDIAVGGAGSEVIVIPDLTTGLTVSMQGTPGFVPMQIPFGSRIAARASYLSGSAAATVGVSAYGLYK